MTKDRIVPLILILLIIACGVFLIAVLQSRSNPEVVMYVQSFKDNFSQDSIIEETGEIETLGDKNWWLNSGARLHISNGTAKTIQDSLSEGDEWRKRYGESSALDTDSGYHPQNIFRLVQRNLWKDYEQQVYFKINKIHNSSSPNKNESNGILLFNRYRDGDNLYYGGLRVDGQVVIKKKYQGIYYTLALKPFGEFPINSWIGIRTEVQTNADNTVTIKLFVDKNKNGTWESVLEAIDDGISFGGPAITEAGHAGIRTDFMDVEFDDYSITQL